MNGRRVEGSFKRRLCWQKERLLVCKTVGSRVMAICRYALLVIPASGPPPFAGDASWKVP